MKATNMHLNEDQVLLSLVDENDLTEDVKTHLQSCALCQEKKMALISELEWLREMAKNLAPLPQNRPVILLPESRHLNFHLPLFATGAGVLLIVFLWSMIFFSDLSKQKTPPFSPEIMGADIVLLDNLLEESALPEVYLDIVVASNSDFDDDFLEFFIPQEELFYSL